MVGQARPEATIDLKTEDNLRMPALFIVDRG